MKISIITVCFNSSKTIAQTLRSVAAQSHADIEHIVVDGGSRDDTADIVRAVGTRVACLISERDHGIYDAMNKGLRLAQGEFVGFLNADDVLATPEIVTGIASCAKAADVLYGDLLYVDKDDPARVVRYWKSGPFSSRRLRAGWMPPHPTFYVRREMLQGLGSFDLRFRIAADYDFMLRCLTQPGIRVAYNSEVMIRMRTGGASNRSFPAMMQKSREDLHALKKNGVGGLGTLVFKNLRKLPQFIDRP
jgi:glycosyltransferase